MPTTANYGWTIPADTDLVKNGALAIRTLGNAIDTTAAASFGGGLVHLDTTNFSAVASQTKDNIFTSTYKNYRIVFTGTCTASTGLVWRFRTSGTDNSNSNYSNAFFNYRSNNTSGGEDARAASSLWQYMNVAANQPFAFSVDIYSPQETTYTYCSGTGFLSVTSSDQKSLFGGGQFANTTQFDGFNLFVTTGSITGTISTFGYKKA